jgi:hypothetical protein
MNPRDAFPTAPPPEDEASTHGGTRAQVCPARRNSARVNPKRDSGMCGASRGKFVKNVLFLLSGRAPPAPRPPTHTPVRRDQPPNSLPGPDKVCTPTQVRPTSDEASTMDHLLDLEWTVVDEVDAALAGTGSPDPIPPQWHDPRQSQPNPGAPARKTEELPLSRPATSPRPELQPPTRPTPRPKISATGRSEIRGRRTTPTDAASRHRGSLTPDPSVGGAMSPDILAATAGPPWSSSAPAAGQWGCCPESARAPDPRPLPSHEPPAPSAGAPRSPRNPRQPRSERRAHCAAAAGANVATTAVKPDNHRRQETIFSSFDRRHL